MPTDRAAWTGDKAFVDRLFRIQPPIGADYSGEWQTDRLFRIQVRIRVRVRVRGRGRDS